MYKQKNLNNLLIIFQDFRHNFDNIKKVLDLEGYNKLNNFKNRFFSSNLNLIRFKEIIKKNIEYLLFDYIFNFDKYKQIQINKVNHFKELFNFLKNHDYTKIKFLSEQLEKDKFILDKISKIILSLKEDEYVVQFNVSNEMDILNKVADA